MAHASPLQAPGKPRLASGHPISRKLGDICPLYTSREMSPNSVPAHSPHRCGNGGPVAPVEPGQTQWSYELCKRVSTCRLPVRPTYAYTVPAKR